MCRNKNKVKFSSFCFSRRFWVSGSKLSGSWRVSSITMRVPQVFFACAAICYLEHYVRVLKLDSVCVSRAVHKNIGELNSRVPEFKLAKIDPNRSSSWRFANESGACPPPSSPPTRFGDMITCMIPGVGRLWLELRLGLARVCSVRLRVMVLYVVLSWVTYIIFFFRWAERVRVYYCRHRVKLYIGVC